MNNLNGKLALVTGGASGIGRAISLELTSLGADVIVHYHSSQKEAEELADEIQKNNGRASCFGADLTREDEVKKLADFTASKRSPSVLDILVNNAGDMIKRTPFESMPLAFIQKTMAVNLESMMLLTRDLLPLLRKASGASVINLSSLAGRESGGAGAVAYAASKGAIISFTRTLAKQEAVYGIRANSVCPGLILGSRFHEIHTPKEKQKAIIENIPVGRAGTCGDVARAVGFLASEYNGFITGISLDINGGVYVA
ncbi:MAG: SDR family oxidoreductase [Spirochaetales bacterium]|nr:SDR family oxidoreductase [Spirochaetales bacterium]